VILENEDTGGIPVKQLVAGINLHFWEDYEEQTQTI